MRPKALRTKKSTRFIFVSAICLSVMFLLGVTLRVFFLGREADQFLDTMNSGIVGSTTQESFLKELREYKNVQGTCSTGNDRDVCYAFGFYSPLLVRVHILPDTVLMGNAIFDGGVLVQKTEFFKSEHFAVSIGEGRPDPETNFAGRVYIAKSTGSSSGFHIQVNPESTGSAKRPVYDFEMKCFLLSQFCRDAHDALPSVEVRDSK